MYNQTKNELIRKITNNTKKIGSNLREFSACNDGQYFKEPREQFHAIGHIMNWTTAFFNGMALHAYEWSGDEELLKWNDQFFNEYNDKVFTMETMHDLGFLYSPYAVYIYNITGDEKYKSLAIKAADELAKRFNPFGNYISAWGRVDNCVSDYVSGEMLKDGFFQKGDGLAIVDCMMNLPLLFWASEATGNPFYKRVAICHAETTIKYFIRDDYSVVHACRFNPLTGEYMHEENYCGYSDGSYWARGTTWAIYGFAIAYRYTKKQEYLDLAIKLCEKFIENCEDDFVPIWDFRLPKDAPASACGRNKPDWDVTKQENTKYNRDVSAAAICICAIKEISKHKKVEKMEKYAENALQSLINKYYVADENIPGILSQQNGQGSFTSFGDYYFVEALEDNEITIW